MRSFLPREHSVDGISITSTVVPDVQLYTLALALQEAKKNGWGDEKIEESMRTELKKLKKVKENRILVRIEISPDTPQDHLFLQKKLKSHLDVDGEGKVSDTTDGEPPPRFDKWQIIQGASMKSFTLARFERLEFEVELRKKTTEVCRLRLVEFLRYHEVPRKSIYETKGINPEARQISLGTIRDLAVDPISIEIAPAVWKPPILPEELEAWQKKLDAP